LCWEAAVPTASSNRVIPKEQLTAWERWELGALAESAEEPAAAAKTVVDDQALAVIVENARKAGHTEGLKAAQAEAAKLRAVAESAAQALEALGQTLAQRTTALAIAMARQIVRDELAARPEAVLAVVTEALDMLPAAGPRVQIAVNPDDAGLSAQHLAQHADPENWRLMEDRHMQRGGCRIVGPTGDVDATLESRWQRVLESLESGNAA
jgi:flagellar assembly protein FliH